MLKAKNIYGVRWLTRVRKVACSTGQASKQRQTRVIIPIHKKGDKRKCTNYRQRWAFIAINYRRKLSAIIYYRLSLSLKIALIYRLPISLLLYILLSPINYRDKCFFRTQCLNFKVSELAQWKNHSVSIKICCNF